MTPAFYDNVLMSVVAHKIDFWHAQDDKWYWLAKKDQGMYSGSMASLGPSYDRD